MATPHVSAAVVLLTEQGNTDALAQKAVLLNTATPWTSNDTPATDDDGIYFGSRWDQSYGWGYLDMDQAWIHANDYVTGSLSPPDGDNLENDFRLYMGQMIEPLDRATLVWPRRIDYASGAAGTMHDLTGMRMYLYRESDNAIVDSDAEFDDNVLQVAGLAFPGVIKIETATAIDGASVEDFALAHPELFAEHGYPRSFELVVSGPASMIGGSQATFTFTVDSSSSLATHDNQTNFYNPVSWSYPSGGSWMTHGSSPAGDPVASHNVILQAPVDATAPTVTAITGTAPIAGWLQFEAAATDDLDSTLEYRLVQDPVGTTGTGGFDTNWSNNDTDVIHGLDTNQRYCYVAEARDGQFYDSIIASFSHDSYGEDYAEDEVVDVLVVNTPNVGAGGPECVFTLAVPPASFQATLTPGVSVDLAWDANGNPPATEYGLRNLTSGGTDWLTGTSFQFGGPIPNDACGETAEFGLRARNGDLIETGEVTTSVVLPVGDDDADGLEACADTCEGFANPTGDPAAFGQTVVALDGDRFGWSQPAAFRMATGVFDALIAGRSRALGPDHPDTIRALTKLAGKEIWNNRLERARPIVDDAYERALRAHGPDHPITVETSMYLSGLHHKAGRLDEAERIIRRAHEAALLSLGPAHELTRSTRAALGGQLMNLGRLEEAETLLRENLRIGERRFGAEHLHTISTLIDLATLLEVKGEFDEAAALCARARGLATRTLGYNHPQTLVAWHNQAYILYKQGRLAEAEREMREVLARRRTWAPDREETVGTMGNLAMILVARGAVDEAERLAREGDR